MKANRGRDGFGRDIRGAKHSSTGEMCRLHTHQHFLPVWRANSLNMANGQTTET